MTTELVETVISYTMKHPAEYEWTGTCEKHELRDGHMFDRGDGTFSTVMILPIFRRKKQWAPDPRWKLPDHCWVWRWGPDWMVSTSQPRNTNEGRYFQPADSGAALPARHQLAMQGLTINDFVPPPTDCVEIENGEVK